MHLWCLSSGSSRSLYRDFPRKIMVTSDADILFERHDTSPSGAVGQILLNRPKALNTLTLDMCRSLDAQLRAWNEDKDIHAILIAGAGEKAFCAGGDIVQLFEAHHRDADAVFAHAFFHTEYRCNMRITALRKPFVAFMDRVVMGGGVGVSVNGSHRIVTERTLLAMPETRIGLFPDIGASYFLSRLPGAMGLFVGLTGARLNGADCVALGLAQHFVPHVHLPKLRETLMQSGVDAAIAAVSETPPPAPILTHSDAIARHFSQNSVEDIFASLAEDKDPWAATQLAALRTFSPLSLKISFREIREGARLSRADCFRMEWRLARRITEDGDFYEGVRALLIDKDNRPQWRAKTLAEINDAVIEDYFAPLGPDDLDLSDIIAPS